MPYALNKLKHNQIWVLTGLPAGSAVTVLTMSNNEKLESLNILVADAGNSARGTVGNKAERIQFRISAPVSTTGPLGDITLAMGADGSIPVCTVAGAVDLSIIADATA